MLLRILAALCVPALIGSFLLWMRASYWRFKASMGEVDAAFWKAQSNQWRKICLEVSEKTADKILEGEQAKAKLAGYLAADLERQIATEQKLLQAERENQVWRDIEEQRQKMKAIAQV